MPKAAVLSRTFEFVCPQRTIECIRLLLRRQKSKSANTAGFGHVVLRVGELAKRRKEPELSEQRSWSCVARSGKWSACASWPRVGRLLEVLWL